MKNKWKLYHFRWKNSWEWDIINKSEKEETKSELDAAKKPKLKRIGILDAGIEDKNKKIIELGVQLNRLLLAK